YPQFIRYNNAVPSPDPTDGDDWLTEIEFVWDSLHRGALPDDTLFYTTDLIEKVVMSHRDDGEDPWQEVWRYEFELEQFTNNCTDCVVRKLEHIVRKEAGGVAWPEVTFEYISAEMGNLPPDNECHPDCSQQTKYEYPLLE